MDWKSVGAEVKRRRLRLNLTQQQLSDASGVSLPTVQNLEWGKQTGYQDRTLAKVQYALAWPEDAFERLRNGDVDGLREWEGTNEGRRAQLEVRAGRRGALDDQVAVDESLLDPVAEVREELDLLVRVAAKLSAADRARLIEQAHVLAGETFVLAAEDDGHTTAPEAVLPGGTVGRPGPDPEPESHL